MAENIHLLRYRNQTPETSSDPNSKKKNKFTSATFRGLGCTQAQAQVSVPALIRTSANWEPKKLKKKKKKLSSNPAAIRNHPSLSFALSSSSSSSSDVWCGPGMGLVTDAASPSAQNCVVSPRPAAAAAAARPRILLAQREPPYTAVRRIVIPEDNPLVESVAGGLGISRNVRTNVSGSRHHRQVRRAFREGLAEIVMLQSSLLMGGRSGGLDRYQDLRLDVDNMSYEELLELGDRIGYVSTGLREDEITHCLRRTKLATLGDLSSHLTSEMERKCTICQEEYEGDDETGTLNCGHFYHIYCIKQWLGQKNSCPVCKTEASSQT